MQLLRTSVVVATVLIAANLCTAKTKPPTGVLAASVGDSVVLVEPSSGRTIPSQSGRVECLGPPPRVIPVAPDVINNQTSVISLRSLAIVDLLDGLTMPHFSANPDRYTAITDGVVVLSYPDRAVIKRISAKIAHPWQVIMAPDGAAMLILERLPDGSTGTHMSTVNLITSQVVYRRPLTGDIRHIALSPQLGLLAMADAEANQVHLVEPATLALMAARPTPGQPVDVAFIQDGKTMATAVDTGDGAGTLDLALFKTGKKGMKLNKQFSIPLGAAPVRMAASPDGKFVAIALKGGSVAVIDTAGRAIVGTGNLPDTPRDLRWCDPTRDGPMVADWSDGETAPDFGTFVPKVRDERGSSGLEEPVWKKPPD